MTGWTLTAEDGHGIRLKTGAIVGFSRALAPSGLAVVAAVVVTGGGVEIVVAGPVGVRVNGIDGHHHLLAPGDRLEVEDRAFRVDGPSGPGRYEVEVDGIGVTLGPEPFTVGGGAADDLRHPGLLPGALRFDGDEVLLVHGGRLGSATLTARSVVPTLHGMELHLGDVRVAVRPRRGAGPMVPVRMELSLGSRGGTLVASAPGRPPIPIALTALRARLFAALLEAWPVEVPDEALITAIWPPSKVRTRLDVNQLVHRTRGDLHEAGLDGRILQRGPGGGVTSIGLPPGATVAVSAGLSSPRHRR